MHFSSNFAKVHVIAAFKPAIQIGLTVVAGAWRDSIECTWLSDYLGWLAWTSLVDLKSLLLSYDHLHTSRLVQIVR